MIAPDAPITAADTDWRAVQQRINAAVDEFRLDLPAITRAADLRALERATR